MNTLKTLSFGIFLLVFTLSFTSAVVVDADYVTMNPGEEARISVEVDNTENFDIENVFVSLDLKEVPFSSVGSSSKDVDDLDEGDDDATSFTLRASTDSVPGDYDIPYTVKYVDAKDNTINFTESGSFGIRISARTDLDFSVETRDTAIIGDEGQLSLEIINRGLGEVKSVSVEIFPQGFELLSASKTFIGSIDSDDSDLATFDVIYKSQNPIVSAKVSYKDFDNNDQVQTVNLSVRVYTRDQALQLGLIQKNNTFLYITVVIVLLVIWFVWRRMRKRRKMREKKNAG